MNDNCTATAQRRLGAALAAKKKRATAKPAIFAAPYGTKQYTSVYIVIDNCPQEWGTPRVMAVFAERKAATEYMLREKGKDVVGGQYIEVQKWRVR